MANPRTTSPPATRAREINHSYGSHHLPSHSSIMPPEGLQPYSEPGAMSIPGKRQPTVPPPLPPPRFLHDLAVGRDPGYHYLNSQPIGDIGVGAGCVSPDSSLRENWDMRRPDDLDFEQQEDMRHHRSPSIPDIHTMGHIDEGYYSLSGSSLAHRLAYKGSGGSGGSALGQRLKGERHLERQNRKDSSHAYDQHLLDKINIGTHKSPPRASKIGSIEGSPISQGPHSRSGKPLAPLNSTSFSDGSFSTTSDSPFKTGSPFSSKWRNSPQSAVVSPSLISNGVAARSFSDYRNPTFDSISTPSSLTDSERLYHSQRASHRSDSNGSALVSGFDDGATSAPGKSKRAGSYDQGIFTNEADLDSDFPTEETRGMRRLQLEDRTPPSIDVQSPNSRLGTKRRASSPPRDSPRDDKAPLQVVGGTSSELYQRRTSGHHLASRASPVSRYHQSHGSVSPASPGGFRNGSYASSAGLSVGGSSSITSISSYGRLSPGAISPLSEHQESRDPQYLSASSESSLQSLAALSHQHITSETKSAAAVARKMSTENANRGKQSNAPKLQANIHMCSCCPKKPKKFETLEELRQHQNEKQYHCTFCHNRFKNKNEAERHQNSLHLRRNSWSCATLDHNYHAAFHPCNAIPPNTNANHAPPQQPGVPAPTDVCGYCGMNFSNFPAPDWHERSTHLTAVHKFGECNQSKKFFRADHFRQHLKHSHVGTSGKWTNMLENSCMKEEPPTPEAQSQEHLRQQVQQDQHMEQQLQGAPVANMMGGGPGMRQGSYGVIGMGMPGVNEMQHTRIDEEMQEEM